METPQVILPSGKDDTNTHIPLMGTLESKFLQESESQPGIQFPKLKQPKKKQQPQVQQNPQPDIPKKKKKKKKKKASRNHCTTKPNPNCFRKKEGLFQSSSCLHRSIHVQ